VVLRSADILALAALGWLAGPAVLHRHLGWLAWATPLAVAAALTAALGWLHCMPERRTRHLRMPGIGVTAGTVAAWLLEAVLVWCSARWVGIPLTPTEAVVVTAASVVSQVAGVAPGGIGTYEAAAAAAYAALGYPSAQGLAAAVVAHGLTTAYSLIGGATALILVRLSPLRRARRQGAVEAAGELPVPFPASVAAVLPVETPLVEGRTA
jgi:hypothetical protein